MKPISVQEGLNKFFAGEPVKLMISDNGTFEHLRPVDAQRYLTALFKAYRMEFFLEDTEKNDTPKKKTPNKPGNREFDRLCKQQDETGDFGKELCAAIEAALEIYDEEDAGVWEEIDV